MQLGPIDTFRKLYDQVGTTICGGEEKARVFLAKEELDKPDEGRTVYLRLELPVTIDGSEVRILRFKGARPRYDSEGAVIVYRGWGVHGIHVEAREDGCLHAQHFRNDALAGAIEARLAKVEFDMMAFAQGKFSTDAAVAWGAVSDSVGGIGVVVAGMSSLGDVRLKLDRETGVLGKYAVEEDLLTPLDEHALRSVLAEVGIQLRALHDSGWLHNFPYWGNIGLSQAYEGGTERVVLRDLDGCTAITGEPLQQARYRFQDVARVLSEIPWSGAGLNDATIEFLRGYFHRQDVSDLAASVCSQGFQRQYHDMLDNCVFIELSVNPKASTKRVIDEDDTILGHACHLPKHALEVRLVPNRFAPLVKALLTICSDGAGEVS